ncbi:hypothetical protein A7X12_00300 [Sphingomonas sp. TDK1]|nr:hypothetical protein A7X12_00300 [Sphingomonas sp. TDK1]
MLGDAFVVETDVVKIELVPPVLDALFPEEREHIARALLKRQAEFATARICARRALALLDVTPAPLLSSNDRAPRWPAGIIGSITHGGNCCAVAVARSREAHSVGIDIERAVPLPLGAETQICTAGERAWLDRLASADRQLLATLHFSAKEALYKCQYPVTGLMIDFLDVQLTIDLGQQRFRIAVCTHQNAPWEILRRMEGEFRMRQGLIVTTALLPHFE